MSLLWRQRFLLLDGEGYPVKDYRLMMRNPDTRLAYLCDRCPCDGGWSIVALCACAQCGPADPFFIGSTVEVDSDTVTAEYGGKTYDLVLLNVENQYTPDTAMSDYGTWGQREAWPVYHGIEGSTRLWGVRHFSRKAPEHSGYYNVQVILDGTVAVEWDGKPYVPGEGAWVGDQVPAANKKINAIMVDHLFDEEGDHTVDLKVSFFGDNDEPTVAYTLRVAVFIVKNFNVDPLKPGQAIIVPHKLASKGDCIVRGEVSGYPIRLYFHEVLKGPFDTIEDAEYVLSTFSGIIKCYAATCVCGGISKRKTIGIDYWHTDPDPDPDSPTYGKWLGDDHGGVGNPGSIVGSPYTPIEVILYSSGIAYWGAFDENNDFRGAVSGKYLIPACWQIRPLCNSDPYDEDPIPWADGEWGDFPPNIAQPCCLDDESSPYYKAPWVYDTGTNEGVPNNSVELADYKASLAI